MTLDNFLVNRHSLMKKVCFRSYNCGNIIKMIIVNINSQTTAFLEDISAVFFEKLAYELKGEIEDFAKQNELSQEDIEEFISELYKNEIIGRGKKVENNLGEKLTGETDKDEMIAFGKELYKCGYLFSTHIDITYDCNLRCIHCYHTFSEYKGKKMLSLEKIKAYIDAVYELGVFSVTLSGGEIFLRKDFEEIVDYITTKRMVIYLLSNGTLIDKNAIRILDKYNIQKIGISLYSLEDSIHDGITNVKGSCERTKSALQMLKTTDIMIWINCVLMKCNFAQYKEMDEFCKKNGFSLTLDTSMIPRLDGNKKPISLSLDYEQLIDFALDSDYNYYIGNNKEPLWNSEPCQAGKISIYCSPSGELYPCVGFRLKLGDLQFVKEIWRNSDILHKWQNIKIADFNGCGEKEYCQYCIEVCAGVCQLENGNYLNGETSNCQKAKARQEAFKRL